MRLRERMNSGCPMLKALPLGDFLKDIMDLFTGTLSGLLSDVTLSGAESDVLSVSNVVCAFAGERKVVTNTEVSFTADTHDVADTKFAAFRVSINSSGTHKLTKSADQDSEALALANVPAVPTGEVDLGYFVVAGAFDATTDDIPAGTVFYPATSILAKYSALDE